MAFGKSKKLFAALTPDSSLSNLTHMKALVTLTAILIFGWLAVVTFYGPELARAINGPEPVKAKVYRR
jgi:hypothetical protein